MLKHPWLLSAIALTTLTAPTAFAGVLENISFSGSGSVLPSQPHLPGLGPGVDPPRMSFTWPATSVSYAPAHPNDYAKDDYASISESDSPTQITLSVAASRDGGTGSAVSATITATFTVEEDTPYTFSDYQFSEYPYLYLWYSGPYNVGIDGTSLLNGYSSPPSTGVFTAGTHSITQVFYSQTGEAEAWADTFTLTLTLAPEPASLTLMLLAAYIPLRRPRRSQICL